MKNFLINITFIGLALGMPAYSVDLAEPPSIRNGFADIVQEPIKAVVNISATVKGAGPAAELNLPEGPWSDILRDFFSLHHGFQGERPRMTSLGSGFIIHPDGYIVTNVHVIQHVLDHKGKITVIFHSGQEVSATVVGADPRSDIAVLKVSMPNALPALKWGRSSRSRVGDWVLAIGNPFGLGGTVTSGIISNNQRNMPERIGDTTHVDQWLQTDAPINQGSSGGPLLNIKGEVIGINTSIFTPTGGNVGIAFAIPSELAQHIVEELIKNGCIKRGWIGIKMGTAVTPELASSLDIPHSHGVLVDGVVANSGAEKAGIHVGDIILKVQDTEVTSPFQLRALISTLKASTTVDLTLWRNTSQEPNKTLTLTVPIKDLENDYCRLPSASSKVSAVKKVAGLTLIHPNKVAEKYFSRFGWDKPITQGAVIVKIDSDSPVAKKLRVGDIIIGVGLRAVETPEDVINRLLTARREKRRTALLLILRPREGQFHYLLTLEDDELAS